MGPLEGSRAGRPRRVQESPWPVRPPGRGSAIGLVASVGTVAAGRVSGQVARKYILAAIYCIRGLGFFALLVVTVKWELHAAAAIGTADMLLLLAALVSRRLPASRTEFMPRPMASATASS